MIRISRNRKADFVQAGFVQALSILALLAVFIRVLVPGGFMLAPTQQNGNLISIQLCSGHGAVPVLFDVTTGAFVEQPAGDGPTKSPQADAPCLFTAFATIVVPLFAPTVAILNAQVIQAVVIPFVVAIGRGLSAPPPWSTGPPVSL